MNESKRHIMLGPPETIRIEHTKLPRGYCPSCGREVALRKGGITREHRADGQRYVCVGSGEDALSHPPGR